MNNFLLQEGLQDICHFRNVILNSNEKIEHKLYRRTTPIYLASYCDFNQEHQLKDQYRQCEEEPRTTDYFTEMDSFSINNQLHNPNSKKDDFINHYLKEYENIKQALQPSPLRQRTDYTNLPHQKAPSVRSQIKQIPLESEVSAFQKIELQFKESKRSQSINRSINRKNISSVTLFPQDLFYDKDNVKKRHGYQSARCFEPHKSSREMRISNKREIRPQSQQKLMRNFSKSNSLIESQRKKSLRKRSNLNKTVNLHEIKYTNSSMGKFNKINFKKSNQQQKKGQSRQEQDKEQICKRIKKRVFLSSAVYKSTDDNCSAIYQKELRGRAEIVQKIMNNEKVFKKYKNANYHIQPK